MSKCDHQEFSGDHHCCGCGGYAVDIVAELEEEKRMWFDRYATLWTRITLNVKLTDDEWRMYNKWAMEVDEEYK
jgi:hypothetical protein